MWVSSALIFLYIYTYKKSPLATASRHPSSMQCWCLFVCLFVITAPIFLLPWILALSVSLAGWRARLLETFWVRSLWWFVFGWGIFVMSGGERWMDGGMEGGREEGGRCVFVSYNPSNQYHKNMSVGECIQSTCPVTSSSFAFQTPCSITGWLAYFTCFLHWLIHPSIRLFLHLFVNPSRALCIYIYISLDSNFRIYLSNFSFLFVEK